MDERAVFERFHEALELEPQPGAYERFRAAFITAPVAAKPRRPVYRMRFSKMGLRVAAALAVVAIAIAAGAAIIATHRPTAGIPAATVVDQNTKDYRALMSADYSAMDRSTSTHCQTIDDPGCAAAIAPVNATLQKWINDLSSFNTPKAYVALDAMIRKHLQTVIDVQNQAIRYQKVHNVAAFTLAMNAAFYERAWVDPATFTVQGGYEHLASSYRGALSLAQSSLNNCIGSAPGPADKSCNELLYGSHTQCPGSAADTCEAYIETTLTQLESFVIADVQNPAPKKLAAKDATYQADLTKADAALLSLTEGLVAGDAGQAGNAQNSFGLYLPAAQGDATDLLNS